MASRSRITYHDSYGGELIDLDTSRKPLERETVLYFNEAENVVRFHCFSPSMIKALLESEGISIDKGGVEKVGSKVVSLKGSFPLNMLSIKKARNVGGVFPVVSKAIKTATVGPPPKIKDGRKKKKG